MIETRDRALLEALLRRDPVWGGYGLADLDDALFGDTRWFLSDAEGRALLLLYVPGPTAILYGEPEAAAALLRAAPLPEPFHLHYPQAMDAALRPLLAGERFEPHLRLALGREGLRAVASPPGLGCVRLEPRDAAAAKRFYDAHYPSHWFEASRLTGGVYLAAHDVEGGWLALGGTHAFSPALRVAAVGDLVVHPAARGRGLGAWFTARLCAALFEQVSLVVLNVASDNAAAIRAYQKVGFARPCPHLEAVRVRRVG